MDRRNYLISIDETKNRVYFQLHKQVWTQIDVDLLLSDWKEIMKYLQNDFTVLSDIRNLQIQSRKLDKSHEEVQKYVAKNGLLKVARVLPSNNDIVNLQFGRIVERSAIPNNVFYTIKDAENYLDRVVRKFEETQQENIEK